MAFRPSVLPHPRVRRVRKGVASLGKKGGKTIPFLHPLRAKGGAWEQVSHFFTFAPSIGIQLTTSQGA